MDEVEAKYRRWLAEHGGTFCLPCGTYGPCDKAAEARVWLVAHGRLTPDGRPVEQQP